MHPEALTSKAKKLIDKLAQLNNLYLAGGTGLALQLGHRKSIDFDFFTPDKINGVLDQLNDLFNKGKIQIIVNQADQLTALINDVKVSFIEYPFPVFDKYTSWNRLNIIDQEIIAAMKAYTIGRRATFKDYVDIYYLINSDIISLKQIIENTNRIYGSVFNDRLFLEQLVYLEDIDEQKIKFIKDPVTKKEIKAFFEKQIKDFLLIKTNYATI